MQHLRYLMVLLALAITLGSSVVALAGDTSSDAAATAVEKASPDEQVASLEAMCAASADDRAARQAETSLYERLGKDENIHALTREVVRLHLENDAIKHFVDENHTEELANGVAQFMIAGMGGPPVYEGPSLTESHEHMKLTNADFLAAGSDVIQAMKNLGYEQNEIDEVVCALVSMRDQVVLSDSESASK